MALRAEAHTTAVNSNGAGHLSTIALQQRMPEARVVPTASCYTNFLHRLERDPLVADISKRSHVFHAVLS